MTKRIALIGLALAATAARADEVVALSPDARAQALEAGAARAAIEAAPEVRDGRVHGEMGVAIGSNGLRAAYGTAVIPLGQTGSVALSYADEHYGGRRAR